MLALLALLNLGFCIVNTLQAAYYIGNDDIKASLPYLGLSLFNLIGYHFCKSALLRKPKKEGKENE